MEIQDLAFFLAYNYGNHLRKLTNTEPKYLRIFLIQQTANRISLKVYVVAKPLAKVMQTHAGVDQVWLQFGFILWVWGILNARVWVPFWTL